MNNVSLTVVEREPGDDAARLLAHHLSLPLGAENCTHSLGYREDGLLQLTECASKVTVVADFCSPRLCYRIEQGLKREMLVRAAGVKTTREPFVVDATAGLGEDAFLLAAAGCTVVMIEQSPVVHALLESGLERAMSSGNTSITKAVSRISLLHGDSVNMLGDLTVPEVIYLDPMFPERKKSAGVKKNMTLLHSIVGHGEDDGAGEHLLTVALASASDRVVVKRPRLAPALGNSKPHWQFTGRSSRFDVYRSMRTSTSS